MYSNDERRSSLTFGSMVWTPNVNEALHEYVARYACNYRPDLDHVKVIQRCFRNLSMKKKYNWSSGKRRQQRDASENTGR